MPLQIVVLVVTEKKHLEIPRAPDKVKALLAGVLYPEPETVHPTL